MRIKAFRRLKDPSESTKGGLDWTGTPAWISQLLSSNWWHMIQKGHVTPTAISCHPLTKAERFCRKFGNFATIMWLCAQNVRSEIMFPESKNINCQIHIYGFFFRALSWLFYHICRRMPSLRYPYCHAIICLYPVWLSDPVWGHGTSRLYRLCAG